MVPRTKNGPPDQVSEFLIVDICVELMKIIYQCVLLAQCDSIVEEASADDLHHPLDLEACKPDPALPESSEDTSMADLDACTRAASALHPG